jgi:hypothetical protein
VQVEKELVPSQPALLKKYTLINVRPTTLPSVLYGLEAMKASNELHVSGLLVFRAKHLALRI